MRFFKLNIISGNRFILLSFFVLFTSVQVDSAVKKVTVVSTTDIHASENWLKLATLIQKERQKAGKSNFLLIDCGDVIQGSFAGKYSSGMMSLQMLNALQYDVWVPGNHDFDFGVQRFYQLAAKFKGAVLAGNIKLKKPLKSWQVFTKNNLKIAVIGLGNGSADTYELSSRQDIELLSIFNYLKGIMPAIVKQKPDIIILAMHHGRFSKKLGLYKLLRRFPEINLVLGGHSHQFEPGLSTGQGWFLQSGSHARTLGKAVLRFDTAKRQLSVQSELVPVNAETLPDENASTAIAPLLKQAKQAGNKVIGTNVLALSSARNQKTPSGISELMGRITADGVGAKYAFHNVPVKSAFLNAGAVTRKELFYLMPYQNTICTLQLNRQQLIEIIKEQFRQSRKSGGRFMHPFGISYVMNRSGSKVSSVKLSDGRELSDDARITVAFSSYAISGARGRWKYLNLLIKDKKCNFQDTGISLRKSLNNYITKHSPLYIKPVKRIKYVKH